MDCGKYTKSNSKFSGVRTHKLTVDELLTAVRRRPGLDVRPDPERVDQRQAAGERAEEVADNGAAVQ